MCHNNSFYWLLQVVLLDWSREGQTWEMQKISFLWGDCCSSVSAGSLDADRVTCLVHLCPWFIQLFGSTSAASGFCRIFWLCGWQDSVKVPYTCVIEQHCTVTPRIVREQQVPDSLIWMFLKHVLVHIPFLSSFTHNTHRPPEYW